MDVQGIRTEERHTVLAVLRAGLLVTLTVLVIGAGFPALALGQVAQKGHATEEAEKARQATEQALRRADGLRLLVHSATTLPKDPTLALLLAIEGARRAPGQLANNALQAALDTCHEEHIFPQGPLPAHGLALLPNGTVLAKQSGQRVRIFDPATGKDVRSWLAHPHSILSAVLSPDGRRVVTIGETAWSLTVRPDPGKNPPPGVMVNQQYSNRVARVWNAATGKQICLLRGHADRVVMASFSADGKKVVTASHDGSARVWDASTGKLLKTLQSRGSLAWARFSPDGRRVLTLVAERHYVERPFRQAGEEIDPEEVAPGAENACGGNGGFNTAETHPDTAYAHAWDVQTGKQLARLSKPLGAAMTDLLGGKGCVPAGGEFSPDGTRVVIAFAGRKDAAWLWDLAADKVLRRFCTLEEGSPIPPVWSADGQRLLYTAGKLAHVVLPEEGAIPIVLRGHDKQICSACFSADGRKVLTAAEDATVRVWNAKTGEPLACFRGHTGGVLSAIFLPGGKVLSCGEDDTLRVWALKPPLSDRVSLVHPAAADNLAYSPDGRNLLTVEEGSAPRVWDVAGRRQVAVLRGLGELANAGCRDDVLGQVLSASFSPDGKRVLVLNDQARVRLSGWFGKEEKAPPFTPVRIFETHTGKELAAFHGGDGGVIHASFSPDGKKVLVGESMHLRTGEGSRFRLSSLGGDRCLNPEARIHDSGTGKVLVRLPVHPEGVVACAWSPNGRSVATACKDPDPPWEQCVRLWDASTGKLLREVKNDDSTVPAGFDIQGRPTDFKKRRGRAGDVSRMAFSPDGKYLLTFPLHLGPGRGGIWDTATGKGVGSFQGQASARTSYRNGQPQQPLRPFSPAGDTFVTVAGSVAWVYETSSSRLLHTLNGHSNTVCTAVFSPDGKWVITASADGTARVWEVKTGKLWRTFSGHTGGIAHAVISPDGKHLATASDDKTVSLWPLDLLAVAEARKPRSLTAAERALYEITDRDGVTNAPAR